MNTIVMWKKPIVFVLLVSFAAATFSKAMIVFGFYLNQSEIAATICENRDKPAMACGGTCFLAKQLQKEAQQEQQHPDMKAENKTEIISSRSFYAELPENIFTDTHPPYGTSPEGKPVQRSFSIFHPPITSVYSA